MLHGCFWGGDGASKYACLITVSFKAQPIRQEVLYFMGRGDGASRHAHLILIRHKNKGHVYLQRKQSGFIINLYVLLI